jgi:uncharacterized protein (DUF1684 family)
MIQHPDRIFPRMAAGLAAALLVVILAACGGEPTPATPPPTATPNTPSPVSPAYVQELQRWRAERIQRLRAPDGWLSLAGLFWLKEGANTFGADPGQDLVIPVKGAPPRVGVFTLAKGQVRFAAAVGADVRQAGRPVQEAACVSDAAGAATILTCGTLSWYVLQRGDKVGVRLKDSANPRIAQLTDIPMFPIDAAWRVTATLEKYPAPREIRTPTAIGTVLQQMCPGDLVFKVGGQECRLQPVQESDGSLFVVFGDQTTGKETYGGGRFLEVPAPDKDGKTVVDFNRAYNPPCVFSPFATCPLPTAQNILPVRVTAGEKMVLGFGH